MTRSALILGTLAGQLDAITMLQDAGWKVYACGHRREGPGVDGADDFFLADVVDVDAVAQLALHLGVDFVYSVGSDIAMPTIARVSERLGLPTFHDVRITQVLHRKNLLREFLEEAALSPVQNCALRSVSDLNGFSAYPAVIKPADSQGQRGISVVESPDEAASALSLSLQSSRSGTAIIEEWLDGPEISVHVVVVDGLVRFFLPSDRHVWAGGLVGIPAAHVLPSSFLDASTRGIVEELVQQFVSALGVREGPLYFQLKLTQQHGPRIIEVASRLDGCHLWRLIEVHTGFNLMAACFRMLAGGRWEDPRPWDDDTTHVLGFALGPPDRPFHASDHRLPSGLRPIFQEFQVEEGELPRDTNGVVARLGYYIAEQQ